MKKQQPVQVPAKKVTEFNSVTGNTNKALAEQLLSAHNLDVNNAVEAFFSGNHGKSAGGAGGSPQTKAGPQLTAALEEEFKKYEDAPGKMQQNGVVKFFEEAGLSMEDEIVFIFSFEGKAETMGEFSKDEWIRTMTFNNCKDAASFGKKAQEIKNRYKAGSPGLADLHKFVFTFYSAGKKSIPAAEAGFLLGLVIRDKFVLAPRLAKYLSEDSSAKSEPVFRDTWIMMFNLLRLVKADGQGYNPEDAWPLLLVNFMESEVLKKPQPK